MSKFKIMIKNFLDALGKSARTIIGLLIVCLSFGFLYFLLYKRIPAENRDVLLTSCGIVLAGLTTVTGYYFGSSKDKSDRDKADIVSEQTKP